MKYLNIILITTLILLGGTVHVQAASSGQNFSANFVPFMVTDPQLCPVPDMATRNKDVKGLWVLLTRQMIEMSTSASAQVPEILAADRSRVNAYIAELEAYQGQVNASDPSDYPGTHRLYYCLHQVEQPPVVTSQAINDLLTLWTLTSGELLTSASALVPADLRAPDNIRLSQHIQSMKDYLAYVDASAVQDYPRQGGVTTLIENSAGIARTK